MQITIQVATAADAMMAAEILDLAAERMRDDAQPDTTKRRRSRRADAAAPAPTEAGAQAFQDGRDHPPPVAAPPVAAPPVAAPPVAAPPVAAPPVAAPPAAAPPVAAPPVAAPPALTPAEAAAALAPAPVDLTALRDETRALVQRAGVGAWFLEWCKSVPEDQRRLADMGQPYLDQLKAAAEAQIAAQSAAAESLG